MLKLKIIKSYLKNIHQIHSMIQVSTQSQSTKEILEIHSDTALEETVYTHRLLASVNHATAFWERKNSIKNALQ